MRLGEYRRTHFEYSWNSCEFIYDIYSVFDNILINHVWVVTLLDLGFHKLNVELKIDWLLELFTDFYTIMACNTRI